MELEMLALEAGKISNSPVLETIQFSIACSSCNAITTDRVPLPSRNKVFRIRCTECGYTLIDFMVGSKEPRQIIKLPKKMAWEED